MKEAFEEWGWEGFVGYIHLPMVMEKILQMGCGHRVVYFDGYSQKHVRTFHRSKKKKNNFFMLVSIYIYLQTVIHNGEKNYEKYVRTEHLTSKQMQPSPPPPQLSAPDREIFNISVTQIMYQYISTGSEFT